MPNKLTISGLALLLAAGFTPAHAGTEPTNKVKPVNHIRSIDGTENFRSPFRGSVHTKGGATIQELKSEITVDSLFNAFSFYTEDAQPFVYKPSINQLAMILRGAEDVEVNPDTDSDKDDLYIRYSNDWGSTWAPTKYGPLRQSVSLLGARYPSFWISTPGDIQQPTYFFSGPLVTNPNAAANEWAWGELVQGLYETVEGTWYADVIKPVGGQYQWGTDCKITSIDDNRMILVGSVTRLADPASENNAFGLRVIDMADPGLFKPSVIPSAWRSDQFVEPTDVSNPANRTSLMVGLDNDGTSMYFAVSGNFIANNEHQLFLPAVSKSTDNGNTWSDFEIFPTSVVVDYNASLNGDVDSLSLGVPSGFVVLGPDRFSMVTTVSFVTPDDPGNRRSHIVEIFKENGTWGIRKIAEPTGFALRYFADEEDETLLSDSQMGIELQMAKSVDGTKLVVKWVDVVDYTVNDATQNSNDIFISARDIGGNWSANPINLTNSLMIDKITWLPNLIPNDLMNIPILMLRSKPNQDEMDEVTANIDIQKRLVNRTQYVQLAKFDAAALVGVNDPEESNAKLLGLASPNPASGMTRIDFTLPTTGHATVDLYNAMGQKILSLFDGQAHVGTTRIDVNTQNLPVGTYYYRLNWDGKTETRMLNVIR